MKKRLAIIGSTGSIGQQALEVVSEHSDKLSVEVLAGYNNYSLLIEQAKKFVPNVVVIGNDDYYEKVFNVLDPLDIKVYAGDEALFQVLEMDTIDMVLLAVVGFAGVKPALAALKHKKPLALANKESLVAAGELMMKASLRHRTPVIPVDSEHSALFQCFMGEGDNPVDKIVLTASGGPFRGKTADELQRVTFADALRHPNWSMGDKISIDSATLMNKGFEVIEARWLFGLEPEKIEVLIHPESVIHSMVYFADGAVKAQMSNPDMRIAIQFAFSYPERWKTQRDTLDLLHRKAFHFEVPDTKIFRNLALAFEAMKTGGNMPCILNASNEIAVEAFKRGRISFLQIPDVVEQTMETSVFVEVKNAEDLTETDRMAREKALNIVNQIEKK